MLFKNISIPLELLTISIDLVRRLWTYVHIFCVYLLVCINLRLSKRWPSFSFSYCGTVMRIVYLKRALYIIEKLLICHFLIPAFNNLLFHTFIAFSLWLLTFSDNSICCCVVFCVSWHCVSWCNT